MGREEKASLMLLPFLHATQRDVPVLHTGLISCRTKTSIPPKVENPGSTSVDGNRDLTHDLSGTALRVLW
jgi:hypothetical protein